MSNGVTSTQNRDYARAATSLPQVSVLERRMEIRSK